MLKSVIGDVEHGVLHTRLTSSVLNGYVKRSLCHNEIAVFKINRLICDSSRLYMNSVATTLTLCSSLAAKHGLAFYLVTNNGEGESWIFVAIFASLITSLNRSAKLNNVSKVVPLCSVLETHL